MEQLALSHPEISFKYIQNKQVKLHTSGNYSVRDVIYSVYGRDIAKALLEVEWENSFMKITGFVGKPEIARGNRSFENYYINGRYVKNNIITKAIENAYKGFLMQHKFPFVSLRMEMEGNDLDVNVHPAKREVRFAREQEVYDAVYDTVHTALTRREMIPKVTLGTDEPVKKEAKETVKSAAVPEPFEQKRREQIYKAGAARSLVRESPVFTPLEETFFEGTLKKNQELDEAKSRQAAVPPSKPEKELEKKPEIRSEVNPEEKQPELRRSEPELSESKRPETIQSEVKEGKPKEAEQKVNEPEPKQLELFEEKLLSPQSRSRIRMIGQVFDTYWLAQFEDKFYIIDQHAAHEKIYYERLVRKFREHSIDSQYLTPPLIVSLNMQEEEVLNANRDYFEKFGFEIEHFGGREYCISAVPSNLYGLTEEELFLEMLDQLESDHSKDTLDIFASRLATMACKAAVKGNNRLSMEEAEKLLDELMTLENPYHCPHGRPTIISMTKTEMEKKFKRIV